MPGHTPKSVFGRGGLVLLQRHIKTGLQPQGWTDRIVFGALGETRTRTACATAPSRQRVYQFHHFGVSFFTLHIIHASAVRNTTFEHIKGVIEVNFCDNLTCANTCRSSLLRFRSYRHIATGRQRIRSNRHIAGVFARYSRLNSVHDTSALNILSRQIG